MSLFGKLLGKTPFAALVEHTKKVHECVILIRPLAEALLAEEYEKIRDLQHEMSKLEHEADEMKHAIRKRVSDHIFFSVDRTDLQKFLSSQDDIADAAEDFAVVLRLRKTKIHPELEEVFMAFVDKVIEVSEELVTAGEELTLLAETGFSGVEAKSLLERVDKVSQLEWEADKCQRRFAEKYYGIEDKLDPVTIMMYDKYCRTLSKAANKAEGTAKRLRHMIENR